MLKQLKYIFLFSAVCFACGTMAEEIPAASTDTVSAAPYALPWQLRSVIPTTSLRIDSAFASYDDIKGNTGGSVIATVLTGALKLNANFGLITRLGGVFNNPPADQTAEDAFLNPIIAGLYSLPLSSKFRMGFFLGASIPIGSGGGNNPDMAVKAALSAGSLSRSALDNALFSVNYFSLIPGIGIAFISNGWTFQLEGTVIELIRVKGESLDKDPNRTNFTTGMLAGYSFTPLFFLEAELRYQKWVLNDTVFAVPNAAEENLSLMIGPRFNFKMGDVTLKPGIAYAQGLAGPMAKSGYNFPTNNYKIIFLDIPIVF
jgi:hypothetical protein